MFFAVFFYEDKEFHANHTPTECATTSEAMEWACFSTYSNGAYKIGIYDLESYIADLSLVKKPSPINLYIAVYELAEGLFGIKDFCNKEKLLGYHNISSMVTGISIEPDKHCLDMWEPESHQEVQNLTSALVAEVMYG